MSNRCMPFTSELPEWICPNSHNAESNGNRGKPRHLTETPGRPDSFGIAFTIQETRPPCRSDKEIHGIFRKEIRTHFASAAALSWASLGSFQVDWM